MRLIFLPHFVLLSHKIQCSEALEALCDGQLVDVLFAFKAGHLEKNFDLIIALECLSQRFAIENVIPIRHKVKKFGLFDLFRVDNNFG